MRPYYHNLSEKSRRVKPIDNVVALCYTCRVMLNEHNDWNAPQVDWVEPSSIPYSTPGLAGALVAWSP